MASSVLPLFPRVAHPDMRPAIRFGAQQLDYATLATACAAFRRTLADAGLSPGSRVGVWAHPELESILGFIGCICAGVVTVPLNAGLGEAPESVRRDTPQRCLTRRKLDTAARLLSTEPILVKEAASAAGFADALHFSRVFRRAFGCSPSDFQARHRASIARPRKN